MNKTIDISQNPFLGTPNKDKPRLSATSKDIAESETRSNRKDLKYQRKNTSGKEPKKREITWYKPELSALQKSELCQAFGLFDPRGLGTIQSRGVLLALRAMSYEPTSKQVENLFLRILKTKETMDIDFKNFYQLVEAKMLEESTRLDVEKAFQLFSDPAIGGVTYDGLKSIADELGEDMPAEEIKEMLNFADYDKDGMVGFQDFNRILNIKKFICLETD